jgi:hypothetical protein
MNEKHDIFLRAHPVIIDKPKDEFRPRTKKPLKWPKYVLAFDTESRTTVDQSLTFAVYRLLELKAGSYELFEEGVFFDDDLPAHERKALEAYMRTAIPDVKSFPPRFPMYSCSEFIKKIFYKYARKGAMIAGFHICFDLARLAGKWPEGRKREWSLILVEKADGSENKFYPRVLIDPIDSKKSFISFAWEWIPKGKKTKRTKINESRFLDLRTLLWALFNKAYSLKRACDLEKGPFKGRNLPQKIEHRPTGKVTAEEIEYARQDVRCTAALLNAAKQEFDLHPIRLDPCKAYSPASIAKAYLEAMHIKKPSHKFKVPNEILGMTMESYMGGRSETQLRHAEVPVVPVDFTSEYPSTFVLLGLWDILTAEKLTFEDDTEGVRNLLKQLSLDPARCFNRELWPDFRFWARVTPDDDIVPVRTSYNGITQNIGNNYLKDTKAIWFAGKDLIASVIRTNKVPQIEKAIRIVPHGKQKGMKPVKLRGMVEIDPYKDDLIQRAIEQRKLNKSNKELYYWLKIFANAIYGFFVEINPEQMPEESKARVRVFSGEDSFEHKELCRIAEAPGKWYAPYLASLITSGGRLLLAMLEASVTNAGGTWLYADTDALAIVSSEHGESLNHILGCEKVRALASKEVDAIVASFESLNPYDRKAIPGSILNLTDDNYKDSDPKKPRRKRLLGMSISAKRYNLYERDGNKITIVNPKAHGLGYLYPPTDSPEGWDDDHDAPKWIYDAWEWIVGKLLNLNPPDPPWFNRLQMMRMAVTTHNVLDRLHNWPGFRPYNFFMYPIINEYGHLRTSEHPKSLVTAWEADQSKWMDSECFDISDPLNPDSTRYRLITDWTSPEFGKRDTAIVETYKNLLYRYMFHPEAKSLGPDGKPCGRETRGLLQRTHVIAGKHRRIGKECDRRWEEGDDFESTLLFESIEYTRKGEKANSDGMAKADEWLIQQVKKVGFPPLLQIGCTRYHLRAICRRELVCVSVLREYDQRLRKYKSGRKEGALCPRRSCRRRSCRTRLKKPLLLKRRLS